MPIFLENDSPRVFYPIGDYSIAKYLDLTKFISLLQRKSLFFCRLDKLEDKFEGLSSNITHKLWVDEYKYHRDHTGVIEKSKTDREIETMVKNQFAFESIQKPNTCVNCWNKFDFESPALWKIYSDFGKGVMIKSSISKLNMAFETNLDTIWISEVKYLNRKEEPYPSGNSIYPVIHKGLEYQYETEIRLIYELYFNGKPLNNHLYDWASEEIEAGLFSSVDLNLLIDEIIIGPFTPNWYKKMIEDLTLKYGLKAVVRNSDLISS